MSSSSFHFESESGTHRPFVWLLLSKVMPSVVSYGSNLITTAALCTLPPSEL